MRGILRARCAYSYVCFVLLTESCSGVGFGYLRSAVVSVGMNCDVCMLVLIMR